MKKILLLAIFFIIFIDVNSQQAPFNRGVNLTGWFQVSSAGTIHFTKYTKEDFKNIKSLGADVIRLPINLHSMTKGAPGYELDPLFLHFLDEVIDWAESLEINLILDNHTFDPAVSTDPNIDDVLIPVWQNMAEHLKERSELVYYEILNEPHGISDSKWNEIQKAVIKAIREIDTVHTIVVGPAGWNSYNNLSEMPQYEDDNLIFTFHFYDPFIFTHQGASWTDPSLVPLAGVPFPYDDSEMPDIPDELLNTWVNGAFNNYHNEGKIGKVRELIDIAAKFKEEREVPLFCGEFGVYMNNADNNDRALWYQVVRSYLESKGIAWTMWDYHGGFGLFEKNSNGLFDHDLNVPLLSALGLNIPAQTDFELKPDTTGFRLYSDYIEANIVGESHSSGILNFYDGNAYEGEFCINWQNPAQYENISFKFIPVKDLSYLSENDYRISFWVKSDNPNAKFDIRFVDTKENEEDHPWRMGRTIDQSIIAFDGTWRRLEVPLSDFQELGSWDNAWYDPAGLFDWKAVETFEIVDEYGALSSTRIWFDEIKIFNPNAVSVNETDEVKFFKLYQNYPNPFNPSTTIRFTIPERSEVTIALFDALGTQVSELLREKLNAGTHSLKVDFEDLSSGVYFYRMSTSSGYLKTRKALILK
jgi:endoglucanase